MRLTQAEIDELLATRTTHRNTFQDDAVTFLRTSAETGGEYTLLHLVAGALSGDTPDERIDPSLQVYARRRG